MADGPLKLPIDGEVEIADKYKIFVDAYMGEANFCVLEALRVAGYEAGKKRSLAAALKQGKRILARPEVREYLEKRVEALVGDLRVAQYRVVEMLVKLAFDNPWEQDPTTGEISLKKGVDLRMVRSVKNTKDGQSITLESRQTALDRLMEITGLRDTPVEVTRVGDSVNVTFNVVDNRGDSGRKEARDVTDEAKVETKEKGGKGRKKP